MPYFKNENINILFIHIPKTGGTSLEKYFSNKYKIGLNNNSLYNIINYKLKIDNRIVINSTLQHITYNNIIKYKDAFKIDFNDIMIISIVRNPYNRIVSDLFYLNRINRQSTQKDVYQKIQKYLTEFNDNHVTPQYVFITDVNTKIIDNIKLLRTETLTADMHNLGFIDFNVIENSNKVKINYLEMLNNDSINLINNYYDNDFKLFNYEKIQV